jgi:hypothetical protein
MEKLRTSGLDGVICQVNDVLVYGKDSTEHDERLMAVLKRLEAAKVTLNKGKCVFAQEEVKFLGHLVNKKGIAPDPEKVHALNNMKEPTCLADLRRFLGMANYLGKFSSELSEIARPLHELLSSKKSWSWEEPQKKAFQGVKDELTKPRVLGLYDPKAPTKIAADASSKGLGTVLLQKNKDNQWKPITYASRIMSEVESHYAQPSLGHVRSLLSTSWEYRSTLRQIINLWFLC